MNSFLKAFLSSLIFFGFLSFLCIYFLRPYLYPPEISTNFKKDQIHLGTMIPEVCSKNPQITFFMYHYIRDHDKKDNLFTKDLSVPPVLFSAHMRRVEQLAESGKIILMTGSEFLKSEQESCFPKGMIWVFTADDGWSDMYNSLVPIADTYRIPFFLGIIVGDIGKKGFLTRDEVIKISQNPLMTISSHSMTHADNSLLSEAELKNEMCNSRLILEEWTGKTVESYIYPSGRINAEFGSKIEKECGYRLTWSTGFGKNFSPLFPEFFQINRIRIHSDTNASFFDAFLKKETSF